MLADMSFDLWIQLTARICQLRNPRASALMLPGDQWEGQRHGMGIAGRVRGRRIADRTHRRFGADHQFPLGHRRGHPYQDAGGFHRQAAEFPVGAARSRRLRHCAPDTGAAEAERLAFSLPEFLKRNAGLFAEFYGLMEPWNAVALFVAAKLASVQVEHSRGFSLVQAQALTPRLKRVIHAPHVAILETTLSSHGFRFD